MPIPGAIFPQALSACNVKSDDDTTLTGPILEPAGSKAKLASVGDAILVVLHPAGANPGRRHTLQRTEHTVGRRTDLDLHFDIDSVSRRHARFVRSGDDWWIEDLGSTNGTFVNDELAQRRKLDDGDIVRFGEAVVKFLAGTNIERAYHEEIYRLSILDGLTNVHNKRFFDEVLEREVARTMRHGGAVTLIIFDIDHFKKVNDTYGHLAGDTILITLCKRIKPRTRREDVLARIGGEEFACLLPETSEAGALAFAEDLRDLVAREPFVCDGANVAVTISLGVAVFVQEEPAPRSDDGTQRASSVQKDALDFLRRADEKLYEAKRAGRNRVAI
jgi:two-component system, cell cycle response regulator